MPELPEVETIVRGLRQKLSKSKIAKVSVLDPRILTKVSAQKFIHGLVGRKIVSIARRAKYIILELSDKNILLVHLGMTGGLIFKNAGRRGQGNPPRVAYPKFTKWFARFRDGSHLYYIDARLFGEIRLTDAKHIADLNLRLGPEPLSKDFKFDEFFAKLQKRKTNIKSLLLNQQFLSGVGNIYATEALFLAGISPLRRADRLKKTEARKLFDSIKKVLLLGIKHRGTTVDSYVDAEGRAGGFQSKLKVYGRGGEKCFRCGATIKRITLGQRGTYYCPGCQR
ncbi:MAG: bifunctional DNA-formamidopyrimidine glycosylase/DNA-(apurinic or apyrimidinic site) lyase [Candidatus Margulisiibacteriota bacterium]